MGFRRSMSTRNAMEIDSPAHIAVVGSLAASVTIGSGSHWPTYSSRCTRADCRWLMHKRLMMVTRNARGDRISSSAACCQRIKVSCSMSSAAATLPNMRYATEKSKLRYRLNVASRIGTSGSGGCIWAKASRSYLFDNISLTECTLRTSPTVPLHMYEPAYKDRFHIPRPDSNPFCDNPAFGL